MAEYEVGTAGSRGIEGIITSHEWVASSESEVVVLEGFWGEGREKEPTREEEGRCEFASRAGRGESEFHLLVLDFWIPHHTRSLSFSVKTNQFESQQRKPSQEGKQLRSILDWTKFLTPFYLNKHNSFLFLPRL